jgi:tetratricopeptide (TPR) repeat protein
MKKHIFYPTTVFFITVFFLSCLAVSCSTASKKPAEVFTQRTAGERQLELANREADRGNFQAALDLLDEARRIAVITDDPSLRIRTSLSRGNILFSLGRRGEASGAWDAALKEAESLANRELAAICRIYSARGQLLAAVADSAAGGGGGPGARGNNAAQTVAAVKTEVNRELVFIKTDQLSQALGWTVLGLAEKESRRFTEAEAAVKKALDTHEKGRYLEQAAYDWYLIASIRSVAGRYDNAREAMEQAIALDRRAENSWGLATDWRALAEIYRKAGKAAEAETAAARSVEIFKSLGIEDN